MRKITVGFSKSKKICPIGSWLIRLYQGFTSFSHCYIKVEEPECFSDSYYHATEGKVLHMSGTQFNKRHEIVDEFQINVPDIVYKNCYLQMHEWSGDDYSRLQNIGIIFLHLWSKIRVLLAFIGIKIPLKKSNPFQDGWNCSEYVFMILKMIYPELVEGHKPDSITPKELYTLLSISNTPNITKNHIF